MIALTASAALEWAPTIRVNCVSPGFIATPLNQFVVDDEGMRSTIEKGTPLARVGASDDVASAVEFLLDAASSYVTGQNLVIDGGSTLASAQVDRHVWYLENVSHLLDGGSTLASAQVDRLLRGFLA